MSDNNELSDFSKRIQDELDKMLLKVAARIKQIMVRASVQVIDDKKISNTGTLRKSIDGEIEQNALATVITVFSNVFYSVYRHEGTKPHYPNLAAIRDWVRLKGLASRTSWNKKQFKSVTKSIRSYKTMNDYYKIDQIARAIAWKIYRKGTAGVKFFEIAFKQSWPQIELEISKLKF